MILGADGDSFGAQNVSFGMLVAPTLARWGTIKRSSGTLEHKKGDVGLDFCPFRMDFVTTFGDLLARPTSEQHMCFLLCVFASHVL